MKYHVVLQPREQGLKFEIDYTRAKLVFHALIERLRERGAPYHAAAVPQIDANLPINMARGTVEHAIFFFAACLWMRGGTESGTAVRLLKKMFENEPNMFKPSFFADGSYFQSYIPYVAETLKAYKLGQQIGQNAKGWIHNMRELALRWKGDPRELFRGKPSFETLCKRIIRHRMPKQKGQSGDAGYEGFMFFREKMVAMLAYFLMDSGLVPLQYVPVPVDFHVLRILVTNRIVLVKGKSLEETIGVDFLKKSVQNLARKVTLWYCKKFRISPIALCDALWLLSRTLCRNNPGNSGYVADPQRHAMKYAGQDSLPFMNDIQPTHFPPRGRMRYLGMRFDDRELEKMQPRFKASCHICPVEKFCKFNVTSAMCYVGGKLVPERLRFVPTNGVAVQKTLFGTDTFIDAQTSPVRRDVRFAEIDMH